MHREGCSPLLRPTLTWLLLLPVIVGLLAAPAVLWSPSEARADDTGKKKDTKKAAAEPIDRDPEASQEDFEEARVAREEQRPNDAATLFWKSLEADLLNYPAHIRYQEMSLKAGDAKAEVVADYDKFIEDYPSQVCFKLHRLRLEDPEPRLAKLAAFAKSHAKHSDVHLEIGRAHFARREYKLAIAALTKALALKVGDRPDVLILLAEAEHAGGKTDAAIARLDAAVKAKATFFDARLVLARLQLVAGQAEPSASNADIVIKQRPSYLAAFLVKSEALVGMEKEDEARETLKSAYRINKENNDVVLAYADLWARMETEASYKQAVKLYEEVLARDDENWRALYGQGWVLERMLKFEEAEEKYRAVAAINTESVAAINSVGYVLFKQGRVSEAQVQFKRALDLDSTFVTAKANLGATFDAQAKYGEAITIYEQILKMKGQEENLRAIINCAFDYEAKGSFPKAQKLLLKAHEILPKDANIVVWLGDNQFFQRKFPQAEKWYQEAIALDEKSFFAWRGLGLALSQRKRWADAAQALEKASKIKPDDLDMYVALGDVYYRELKDLKTALAKYEEFIQRGGNDPDVRDVILEIKKLLEKK